MADDFYSGIYNPDVLSCIANLSNDEVFTPPEVANTMLDLLPQELFVSTETTFLDPACKSGVFLREIAKRLLAAHFPNYKEALDAINAKKSAGTVLTAAEETYLTVFQAGVDHIFHHQLFGIAITELTSLLSRRSIYCSKFPNGEYSVSHFDDGEGNIRFKRIEHRWKDGKCVFCGANQSQYDRDESLESHAYEWIHTTKPEEIWKMKFDVIISNPPYQLSDGGNAASAMPIYQLFVQQAMKLRPKFLTMIIPARWYVTGRGLDSFRQAMLTDDRIRVLHDYPQASDCFPGVEIKGGICFFLWDRETKGLCKVFSHNGDSMSVSERPLLENGMETFIRNDFQADILHKVRAKGEVPFSSILNAGRFFGFHTKIEWNNDKLSGGIQTADGQDFIPISANKEGKYDTKIYIHGGVCWIKHDDIPKNVEVINEYKILLPRSGNPGSTIIGKPKICEPGSCSSNSYVVALPNDYQLTRKSAANMLSYISTEFFRFLVSIKSVTQDVPPKAYELVPMQDFSKSWTDKELYEKYGLTETEIAFIESTIKPLDVGGDSNA